MLLARPALLLTPVGRRRPDAAARRFARLLGARQVLEAALLGRRPSAARLRTGAAVDGVHALSTAVLGRRPHQRRLARANSLIAVSLATTGLWLSTRAEVSLR